MLAVEPQIVMLLQQMAKMHQHLNSSEALALANSLIEGTDIEKQVREWKNNNSYMKNDEATRLILGKDYWNGFWKCNGHLLE